MEQQHPSGHDATTTPPANGHGDHKGMTSMQALLTIVALVPIVAGYFILGTALQLHALYMGFLFCTYWGTFKGLAPAEFVPSVLGALAGIGAAFCFDVLAVQFGTAGLGVALLITAAGVYFFMRNQLAIVFNSAFVLFLTVSTIPALVGTYADMALGMLYGAAFAGALLLVRKGVGLLIRPKADDAVTASGRT